MSSAFLSMDHADQKLAQMGAVSKLAINTSFIVFLSRAMRCVATAGTLVRLASRRSHAPTGLACTLNPDAISRTAIRVAA
jgi:hypothetical protein